MDCSLPDSSVHGIPQARILEWVAMPSSRRSSQPREQTLVYSIYLHCQVGYLPLVPPDKPLNNTCFSLNSYSALMRCINFDKYLSSQSLFPHLDNGSTFQSYFETLTETWHIGRTKRTLVPFPACFFSPLTLGKKITGGFCSGFLTLHCCCQWGNAV